MEARTVKRRTILITEEILDRVRTIEESRGLTRKEIAEHLGVSSSYFSDLIYQRRSVSVDMQDRIIGFFSWRSKPKEILFMRENYTTSAGAV